MLKFNKVLLASDFDNTLVYTQGALERGEDIPPMSARNREAVEYFIQNGVTRKEYWKAKVLAAFTTYGINVFLGSTYYFAFQQFYPKNNYLLNVFSISDVNALPFAVVLYVDGMMTAMLIGCVFSILEKNGKIVLALSLVGMNAVWGSGVFEIEKHNAFTSFLLGIESMIKGMNPVYPAIIYAIVSISLCLLVMKRFKLRFE